MARAGIQIGRVSAQTGLGVDAIRFYEREGLLESVSRTEGGFRLFTARDVQRLVFKLRAQKLGFSLSEIRELLILQSGEGEACCHLRDLLRTKLAGVRAKLGELGSLEEQLTRSLPGRATYARRQVLIEPVFGVLKEQRGTRQFRRRGLQKVAAEIALATTAYNLTRIWHSAPEAVGG